MATNSHLVIATIDFGTTYSGYAYGFRHDLEDTNEKTPIHVQSWINELGSTSTEKTPTSILFTPDGQFHSFGYEAENKYADLTDDDDHEGWKFFKHFKMKLHDTRIGRNTRLKDDQGKPMLAIEVFAAAIRYLKDKVIASLKAKVPQLNETDIYWVITVPAIWTYRAKQFMKAAASDAGLCSKSTGLAHEPEAAAIYCRHFDVNLSSDTKGNTKLSSLKEGSQFMVLDLGGGTVDITTFEVQSDGTLKELCPRGGGPWGGNIVNAALYSKLFNDVFGEHFMVEFAKENKHDHLRMTEALELKKRKTGSSSNTASNGSSTPVRIVLPSEFLEFYKRKHRKKLEKSLSNPDQYPYVKKGKIWFAESSFEEAFQESTDMLITEVKTMISKYNLKNVHTFMMVGGFAESPIMQKAVKDALPDRMHVIIPMDASTVVMKGAVMYGFRKASIRSRKLPYTFGLSVSDTFDPLKHPRNRRPRFNGKVTDIFSPFIQKGTEISSRGIIIQKTFGTRSGDVVEIYQTPADYLDGIVFTDDESLKFEEIGKIRAMQSTYELVDVRMTFGIFDIEVAVRPHGTKEWKAETFDAL